MRPLFISLVAMPLFVASGASAQAQDLFGAIARSRNIGDKGYAWNYATRAAAENAALRQCEGVSGAGDCSIMVWFRNACGSVAESSNGGAGSGWGANSSLAENAALRSCRGIGGSCRITRTICTGD